MTILILLCLICAAVPAYFYGRNQLVFHKAPAAYGVSRPVSVLIPARNEAANIAQCLDCICASTAVELEVLVLDDHSDDNTAELVNRSAEIDPRICLIEGQTLPPGWNGKQHACWQLAQAAQHELLVFIDADVRLTPDALSRGVIPLVHRDIDLVSGFPRQITATLVEAMLLPLIHFVLLGFLSLRAMRQSGDVGFGAGCGQWFLTSRDAYFRTGGHAAIRGSRHDGLMLPRLYRQAGLRTDLFDATDTASCRMYEGAAATWRGLAKNATEGIANLPMLPIVTIILLFGQVAPLLCLVFALLQDQPAWQVALASVATLLSFAPRLHAAWRYQQSFTGALLHPVAIAMFLVIQWEALFRSWIGRPVQWKGRVEAADGQPCASQSSLIE